MNGPQGRRTLHGAIGRRSGFRLPSPRAHGVHAPRLLALAVLAACSVAVAWPAPATAGQAATGDALFYPCTACHPVQPSSAGGSDGRKLPNGFEGHRIALTAHKILGRGPAACLVCHDSPQKNPGKLRLVDGGLVDIQGDVSGVCFRCHSAKFAEWKAGTHGKHRPKCTAAGCHDPHAPESIYASPIPPFVGTGFQVQVLPERKPFAALAPPAAAPPVETPAWLQLLAVLGVVAGASIAGSLATERSKR